jgi:UDP:flavonoid glycosyltransferase YjiC (YdhE family)
MARVLVYTSPERGRTEPMVPGLLALRDRGHDIHVRTIPELVEPLRSLGISADPVDPRIPEFQTGAPGTGAARRAHRGLRGRLTAGLEPVLRRAPYEGRDFRRALERHPADAVLCDAGAYGAVVGAEACGLPWGVVQPTLLALRGQGIPPFGLGGAPSGSDGPVQRLSWWRVERAYQKDLLPAINNLRREADLPELPGTQHHFLRPHVVIVLSAPPIEPAREDQPINVRFAGPAGWEAPAPMPGWLEEPGDPWVVVRSSASRRGDQRLITAAARGLQAELVRVCVHTRDVHGVEVPQTPNLQVERVLPLGAALERAAALVCHGDLVDVQRALGAGVPVVAVPVGGEEPEVAARLARTGAGVVVPAASLTPPRLRAAVTEAIGRREAAGRVGAALWSHGGPAAVADAVEELLG